MMADTGATATLKPVFIDGAVINNQVIDQKNLW
jgi:hypothetical protein